jgi:hypothetical protein
MSWILKPLALASTLALSTLGVLSRRYQKARFYFHFTLYLSTLGLASAWGVIVSILATAAGQVGCFSACRKLVWWLGGGGLCKACSAAVGYLCGSRTSMDVRTEYGLTVYRD